MRLYEGLLTSSKCTYEECYKVKNYLGWLNARRRGIGGSDAGAIMGLNPYSSPLSVWYEKVYGGYVDTPINTACHWGNILEGAIRDECKGIILGLILTNDKEVAPINPIASNMWGDIYDEDPCIDGKPVVSIEDVPGALVSKEHPYMRANLDGLISLECPLVIGDDSVVGLGGLEIKTSSRGIGFAPNEVPDSYYAQVQHYMAVTGLEWFLIVAMVLDSRRLETYIVRRNETFIQDLIEVEGAFWDKVVSKVEPAPIGRDCDSAILQNMANTLETGYEVTLDSDTASIVGEIAALDNKIKGLETDSKRLKQMLQQSILEAISSNIGGTPIGEGNRVTALAGDYSVSWNRVSRTSIDTDALKKAGIYDKYTLVTDYRTMRIKRLPNSKVEEVEEGNNG